MPAYRMFLITRETTGHHYTVVAASHRGAMKLFRAKYRPPTGEVYMVRERGTGDEGQAFKVTK